MGIPIIAASEFQDRRARGEAFCLVDVRTPAEYAEAHADGAEPMPLADFDPKKAAERAGSRKLALICQSGARAKQAAEKCEAAGVECLLVDGGTESWKSAGLPIARPVGKPRGGGMSIERQVRLGAGLMAAAGGLLALVVNPLWALLPLFVGCGLTVAGATGWCGLALVLARMPWNR